MDELEGIDVDTELDLLVAEQVLLGLVAPAGGSHLVIIERPSRAFVVYAEDPVLRALEKITANKARIIFCVTEHGRLLGSLSDGDVRRWIAAGPDVDLDPALPRGHEHRGRLGLPQRPAVRDPAALRAVPSTTSPSSTSTATSPPSRSTATTPCASVATTWARRHPPFVIAEIGNNHNGSVDLAKQLVDLRQGVRRRRGEVPAARHGRPLPRADGSAPARTSARSTPWTCWPASTSPPPRLVEVFDHARDVGIDVLCTPWDAPERRRRSRLRRPRAEDRLRRPDQPRPAPHMPRIRHADGRLDRDVDRGRDPRERGRPRGPPAPPSPCSTASRRTPRRSRTSTCATSPGWPRSGTARSATPATSAASTCRSRRSASAPRSSRSTSPSTAAMEGNDHKVSLLPGEFGEMVARIREVEEALGTAAPAGGVHRRDDEPGQPRQEPGRRAATSRRASSSTADAVDVKSPGRGLQPNALDRLVGRTAQPRPVRRATSSSRPTSATPCRRPARTPSAVRGGCPSATTTWPGMTPDTTPDFLEFHFSYKDLDLDPEPFFADLPEHCTDGDVVLAMSYAPPARPVLRRLHRQPGLARRRRTGSGRSTSSSAPSTLTRALTRWFTVDDDPVVVATWAASPPTATSTRRQRPRRYERVAAAVDRVDDGGVRLTRTDPAALPVVHRAASSSTTSSSTPSTPPSGRVPPVSR